MMTDTYSVAAEFITKALRVWADAGVDPRDSDFVEALSIEGKPIAELPRRGRTQARQVLTFAMAHAMGDDPDGHLLDVASRGYDTLQRKYMHTGGGLLMAVNPDGSVADGHRYGYELAFLLMAQGWLHRATGEARYAADAEAVWSWLEDNLRDPEHDGFRIGLPTDRDIPRQQNPHMHLFEACLLNLENIGGDNWRERLTWLYGLFCQHFFDGEEGCIREFFDGDWNLHALWGDRLEPGHHFEWTWLLGYYARMTGEIPRRLFKVYAYGIRHGLSDTAFGWDEIRPQGVESRATSRLWVQCEVFKGHLTLWTLTGDDAYRQMADSVLARIIEVYLNLDSGCWHDQFDKSGQLISGNSPASTLYHLYVAFAEYRRRLSEGGLRAG